MPEDGVVLSQTLSDAGYVTMLIADAGAAVDEFGLAELTAPAEAESRRGNTAHDADFSAGARPSHGCRVDLLRGPPLTFCGNVSSDMSDSLKNNIAPIPPRHDQDRKMGFIARLRTVKSLPSLRERPSRHAIR